MSSKVYHRDPDDPPPLPPLTSSQHYASGRDTPASASSNNSSKSPIEIMRHLGYPDVRARKALAATAYRGIQIASDWILARINDPDLDVPSPRTFVVYLCPVGGELSSQIETFFDASRVQIGRNGGHRSAPHITIAPPFRIPDDKVCESVSALFKASVKFHADFTGAKFRLDKYISPNFFGLFACKREEILLRSLAQEISSSVQYVTGAAAASSTASTSRQPSPAPVRDRDFHLTLAYQFSPQHFSGLEDLSLSIDPTAECEWELRLYSYDEKARGKDVYKVVFPFSPPEPEPVNDHHRQLELMRGDFIYIDHSESPWRESAWVVGTSWLTGCTGLVPTNYIEPVADVSAWTLHFAIPMSSSSYSSATACSILPVIPGDRISCFSSTSSLERLKGAIHRPINDDNELSRVRREKREDSQALADNEVERIVKADKPEIKSGRRRNRRIYISRHGERVDFTFGVWLPYCFDENGQYTQKDLNMPLTLPNRASGKEGFTRDCPLTRVGVFQASSSGEALRRADVKISHCFVSPSLRCVQTAHHILKELGLVSKVSLHIEPGLFEWMAWYENAVPDWMSIADLRAAGYNVEESYKPFFSTAELVDDNTETLEQFYSRNFFVTQCILQATEDAGGDILLVAHAANLETCTRQMIGQSPRSNEDFMRIIRKVPYCSLNAMEERKEGPKAKPSYTLIKPPILPLTHSSNQLFDWKILQSSINTSV